MRKIALVAVLCVAIAVVVVLFVGTTTTVAVVIDVDPNEEATCLNPGFVLEGQLWQTSDAVPTDTEPGSRIEGVFTHNGSTGIFEADGFSLEYQRPSGQFANLDCRIAGP